MVDDQMTSRRVCRIGKMKLVKVYRVGGKSKAKDKGREG